MKNKLARLQQMQNQKRKIPVKSTLQAKFSKNKIVVPAKGVDGEDSSMFNNFYGEDNTDSDDYNNFDGKAFVSKNKGVLIGLGIGVIAILVMNKMKVFK
jgi:hypothetical protein